MRHPTITQNLLASQGDSLVEINSVLLLRLFVRGLFFTRITKLLELNLSLNEFLVFATPVIGSFTGLAVQF